MSDVAQAIAHCRATWHADPAGALMALRCALPTSPSDELALARELVVHAEWKHRIDRGLMPYHASTLDELGFGYAAAEFKRYRTAVMMCPSAQLDAACLDALGGPFTNGTTPDFAAFTGHVMSTVDFFPPPYRDFHPGPPHSPIVWLGHDLKYNVFARPLMRSIASHGDCVGVDQCMIDAHPLGAIWYHAARFIHLWRWMQENDRPVWMLDVDALANRPLSEMFPLLEGHDVAFRARPGRIEPWNQYNACVVGFNNTPAGKAYLHAIAKFIERAAEANNLRWGIDQVAMLCCLDRSRTKVRLLDDRVVDYGYRKDGIIFCNSGRNKFDQLTPGYVDKDRVAYTTLLQRYLK